MNDFDQASRFAVALDPPGFLVWALGLADETVLFREWLDTRNVVFPGGAERTGDLVARLEQIGGGEPPWAVAVEFQIEPDPLMFGRLLVYLGHLWTTVKSDEERGSRFNIGAVVVNLTGQGNASRDMRWAAAGIATQLKVKERNMAGENADELLTAIEAGARSRGLLPWIPLMTDGGETGIIERWKSIAESDSDFRRKANYAGLARVFADAADRKPIWDAALEGWNVKESSVVKEWREEGKAEGQATALIAVLEARFSQVPAELQTRIGQTADLTILKSWLTHAVRAASLAEFRTAAGL